MKHPARRTVRPWLAVGVAMTIALGAHGQSLQILAPDCRAPDPPPIPDGNTASEPQLEAAQTRLKSYLADGDEYLNCLTKAEESLGSTIMPEQKAVLVGAYNSMVDSMQASGTMFNDAVKAFKARP